MRVMFVDKCKHHQTVCCKYCSTGPDQELRTVQLCQFENPAQGSWPLFNVENLVIEYWVFNNIKVLLSLADRAQTRRVYVVDTFCLYQFNAVGALRGKTTKRTDALETDEQLTAAAAIQQQHWGQWEPTYHRQALQCGMQRINVTTEIKEKKTKCNHHSPSFLRLRYLYIIIE